MQATDRTGKVHENKRGLHSLISHPVIYDTVQLVAGSKMYRTRMVRDYVQPFAGCRILDIGCGTGEYVEFLAAACKDFEYYGFDAEQVYIEAARERYANRRNIHFFPRVLTDDSIVEFADIDIVMAMGVMHHMDDERVLSLLRVAKRALKPSGRLVSYDPGRFADMNWIEKFFLKHDRGRNIRSSGQYDRLVGQVFPNRRWHEERLTYYPCRNVIFVCTNA